MGKLLFFDIDGTLIDVKLDIRSITDETKKSLDELKENGHDVFLATGRCKCFIVPGVFSYPFSGYVTCNGAYVEYKNQCLYKAVVPAEAIKATQAISDQLNFNYYFESNDYIYIHDKKDPKHIAFAKQWGMRDEVCVDEFDPEAIESYIGMIVVNDKKDIPAMVEALSPYFEIQRHQSDYSFDLTLRGESKAVGINHLVEAMGKDIKDTIAFGDGRNDIEMLEEVGIGVAMGNACQEAKSVADYITDTIDNDGISKALMNFDLIDYRKL